jgi:hypothetical protein
MLRHRDHHDGARRSGEEREESTMMATGAGVDATMRVLINSDRQQQGTTRSIERTIAGVIPQKDIPRNEWYEIDKDGDDKPESVQQGGTRGVS